ncbi:hypothetical protein MASR1M45_01360 [Candidatus Kapaibacterium sp.]
MKTTIIAILISLSIPAFSQFDLNLNSQSGVTNVKNMDSSSFNTPLSQNFINLSYDTDNSMSYYGGLGLMQYFNLPERNFLSAYYGLSYSTYTNKNEDASFNMYVNGLLRQSLNDEDLSNSSQYAIGAQYISQLSENSVIYLSDDINYKSYGMIKELNYLENSAGITFNTSFETKTSLKIESGLYSKIYSSLYDDQGNLIVTNSGKMNRKFNSLSNQLRYTVTIAQNVFENTGLSFSVDGAYSIDNYDTPLDYIGFDFAGDNEFFDDPYSYDYNNFKLMLTQILPLDTKLSLSGNYADKYYNYFVVIDDENDAQRIDYQSSLEINLSKTFNFEDTNISFLKIQLEYQAYLNKSNLGFMNFDGNFFLVGLQFGI